MINDYTVQIKYKNRRNEFVGEKVYPFAAYTASVGSDLKKVLNDIERYFGEHNQSDETYDARSDPEFMNIRKHILDAANTIERLPETICCNGVPIRAYKASEYISDMVNSL